MARRVRRFASPKNTTATQSPPRLPAAEQPTRRPQRCNQLAIGRDVGQPRLQRARNGGGHARARSLSESSTRLACRPGARSLGGGFDARRSEAARELADRALETAAARRRVVQSWAHYIEGQTRFFAAICPRRNSSHAFSRAVRHDQSGAFPQNPRIDSLAAGSATCCSGVQIPLPNAYRRLGGRHTT